VKEAMGTTTGGWSSKSRRAPRLQTEDAVVEEEDVRKPFED